MKRTTLILAMTVAAALASAQSRSSFLAVDAIEGIDVSTFGLDRDVQVGLTPRFQYNGTWYDVVDVFGFWSLSDDDDLVATGADTGVWSWHQNQASTGGIAGWKTNPNTGLTAGENKVFTYGSINASSVERYGFHVRLDGTFPGTNGNTGYITTVPEPGSMIALGAGLAAFAARRRKKRA
jgi:hypothetical protein